MRVKNILPLVLSSLIISCSSLGERILEWESRLPTGFNLQIECSKDAEGTYHAITDTSIHELQTERGAARIGGLITEARDCYRRWQSYGNYFVPSPPVPTMNFGGIYYNEGLGYNFFTLSLGKNGYIKSSRNRLIFSGKVNDERYWEIHPPFSEILKGDRMEDIPSLIGRIKR